MINFEFHSKSESDTFELGRLIGCLLVPNSVIYLNGTLGSGKSRLVQAIAAGLEIDAENVQSPTFTLMTPHHGRLTLVHVDAYRINDLDEAEQLGLTDWLTMPSVLAIEWADRIADALPNADLRIQIEHVDQTERRIHFEACSTIGEALLKELKKEQSQ